MVELPRDPITDQRRRKWAIVKGSKRKAQFELQKLLVQAQGLKARSSSASLSTYLGNWLEWISPNLASQTIRTYGARIAYVRESELGVVPLDELKVSHIDRLYSKMALAGQSYYVIRQLQVALRSALNQAVKWGQLDRNPASMATLPQAPTTETVAPSVEQLSAILREARASNPQWP